MCIMGLFRMGEYERVVRERRASTSIPPRNLTKLGLRMPVIDETMPSRNLEDKGYNEEPPGS